MSKEAFGNHSRTIRSVLAALPLLVGMAALAPANGHDWYPKECCQDKDCAPVENMTRIAPADGGDAYVVVSSRHGKAVLRRNFPLRESKDSRMHVCLGHYDTGDKEIICIFMPPGA